MRRCIPARTVGETPRYKYNGAPYIVQRAGEAVYSEAGKTQLKEQVGYYMNNAKTILKGLQGRATPYPAA